MPKHTKSWKQKPMPPADGKDEYAPSSSFYPFKKGMKRTKVALAISLASMMGITTLK
jgi:hypothetical protein